jgi:hypothetical protein
LDKAREEWNRPDGLVQLARGGLPLVRTEDNLRESAQLLQYMQFLISMMQRTSGINDALIGFGGTNERSAQQQQTRISQGTFMQTGMFERLFQARKRITVVTLRLIGAFYTDHRIARVLQPNGTAAFYHLNQPVPPAQPAVGPDGQPVPGQPPAEGQHPLNIPDDDKTPLANEIGDILRYDVILKPVPQFTTVRQNTMTTFAEVAKSGVIPPEIVGRVLLELTDLPNKPEILYQMEQIQAQQRAFQQQLAMQQAMAQGQQAQQQQPPPASTPPAGMPPVP